MKKLIYILSIVLIIGSCENVLEITSPSTLTAQGFWDSENGAMAAHTGLYGDFRGHASTFWLLGEIRSDIWGGKTFESPFNLSLIESNFTVTTAPFGGWAGFYGNIHRVNDFILNVPNIEFQNEETKNHLMGQAYGLRAYYYYTLLKTWGGVPISTEPLTDIDPANLSKPRASEDEVMSLIKADITASLSAFGDDDSFWAGNKNFWSKAATLALKGDVYIWSGNIMNGGTADLTEAKTALEQIAGLGIDLVPNYNDLWGADNENNQEFIFAIQYAQDEASNYYNSMTGRTAEINSNFDGNGNSMSDFIIGGANRYGPTDKLLAFSDDELDSRKEATFIRLYTDDNGGNGYSTFTPDKYFGAVINKFLGKVDESVRIFDNDIPVYRYADVLLMIAETKNLLGEDPSGEINAIRQRAYGANYNPAIHEYSNGSQTQNTNAILNERYKEFVAEGKRWWDLRRAGDQFVINEIQYLDSGEEYKVKLPITLDMIGRNPALEQTPGWTTQ